MRILQEQIKKKDLISQSENFIDDNAIKAVVDIEKKIMAVDAPMHYDLEQLLLEKGSEQKDVWGINLYLDSDEIDDMVEFDSMINIRPAQGNRSRGVEDEETQRKIKVVVEKLIG